MNKIFYYIITITVLLTELTFALDFKIDNGDDNVIDNNIASIKRGFYDWQYYLKYPIKSNYCEVFSNIEFGNLIHTRTDFYFGDIAFPVSVKFYYNSASNTNGIYGNSWKCNLNVRYVSNNYNKNIIVIMPDDRNLLFNFDKESKKFQSTYGTTDSLELLSDSLYKLKIYNDNYLNNGDYSEYYFESKSHHYVTRIADKNKNTILFEYDNDKYLIRATYPSGRKLNFSYFNNKLSSINYEGLKSAAYFYGNSDNLDNVIFNNNYQVNYLYNNICNKLSSISENNSSIINLLYNEQNQISKLLLADSSVIFSIDYNSAIKRTDVFKNDKFFSGFKYDSLFRYTEIIDFNNNSEQYYWNIHYQLDRFIDKNSNKTEFSYGQSGKIKNYTTPENTTKYYEYDSVFKKITSYIDEERNIYDYKYDDFGNLELINRNSQLYLAQQFDENGLPITNIDALNRNWFFNYDKFGNIAKITFPNFVNYTFESDKYSNITSFYDANINKYQFVYNYLNSIQLITYPDNFSKKFIYNFKGFLTSIIYPDNTSISINYDKTGRVNQYSGLLSEKYQFSYENDEKVRVILPDTESISFDYLPNNYLQSITNSNQSTYTYSYDKMFNVKQVKKFDNTMLKYDYDKANRVTSITDLNNRIFRYSYFPSGKIKEMINANNEITTFNYNYNSLSEITKPLGFKILFNYDSVGNITSFQDANNNNYKYLNDFDGKLLSIVKPNLFKINYVYDNNGNIIFKYNENNDRIEYKFNVRNTVKEIINESGNSKVFSLDPVNKITQLTDELDNIFKYEFDKAGRIITITYPNGFFKKYTYDNKNNALRLNINNLSNKYFKYNNISALTEINSGEESVYLYNYNSNNELTSIDNQIEEIKILYDKINRPINIIDCYNKIFTINYNNNSLFNKIILPAGNSYEVNYNGLSYPVNISYPENSVWTYFYDLNGNIKRAGINEYTLFNLTYNNINKLEKVITTLNDTLNYKYNELGKISYFRDLYSNVNNFYYDKKGNLITIDFNGDSITYSYDAINRVNSMNYYNLLAINLDYYNFNKIKNIFLNTLAIQFAYDSLNQLNKVKLNNVEYLKFIYTNKGNISSVLNSFNNTLKFSYNKFSSMTSKVGQDNIEFIYEYDLLGRLNNTYDSKMRQTKFDYNENGLLSLVTNREMIQTNYYYDKANRLKTIKFNRTDSIELSYNYFNQITKFENQNNQLYKFDYDLLGRISSISNPLNNSIKFKYIPNNSSFNIISPKSDTSIYHFDKFNRLISLLKLDSIYYRINYNKLGLMTSNSNNNNIISLFSYDSILRLKIQFSDRIQYSYIYSDLLKVDSFKADNDTFKINYNSNLFSIIKSSNNHYQFSYNSTGNLINYKNNSKSFSFGYDKDFGLQNLTAPNNYSYSLFFDAEGRVDSTINPLQNRTYFLYDGLNNLRKTIYYTLYENSFNYDQNSNLILYTNELLNRTEFKYDDNERITTKSNKNNSITTFKYDRNGNTTEINKSEEMFNLMNPYYDELNRFIGLDMYFMGSIKREAKYSLDAQNKLTSINFNDLENIKYNYLPGGKIHQIIDYKRDTVSYKYFSIDNKKIVQFPNGIIMQSTSNLNNQIIEYVLIDANNTEVLKRNYQYDEYGNITQIKYGNDSTHTFEYDNLDQLTGIFTNTNDTTRYFYDANGNRILQKHNDFSMSYNYNSNDNLLSFDNVEYTYDNNGNVISKADSNGTIQFYYNSDNRLTKAVKNDTQIINFHYSGNAQLIRISGVKEEFYFPFQIENEPNSNILMEYDNNQILKKRYIFSPNDSNNFEIIGYIDINSNKKYYIHTDPSGMYSIISNENGDLENYSLTDIFGNSGNSSQTDAKFGFKGMIWIDVIKMYYFDGRFYDPICGRFIQKNKKQFSISSNEYVFNRNNPIKQDIKPIKNESVIINEDLLVKNISPYNNIYTNSNSAYILNDLYNTLINKQFNDFANFNIITKLNYDNFRDLLDSNYENPIQIIEYFKNCEINNFTEFNSLSFYPKLPKDIYEPYIFESINKPLIQELSTPELSKNNKLQKIIDLISMTDLPAGQHYKKQLEFLIDRTKTVEYTHNNIMQIKLNDTNLKVLSDILDNKYNFKNIYKNTIQFDINTQFNDLKLLDYLNEFDKDFYKAEPNENNYAFSNNLFPLIKNIKPNIQLLNFIPKVNEFSIIKKANYNNMNNLIHILQNISPENWNFAKVLYKDNSIELPYSLEYKNNFPILPIIENFSKIPIQTR